MPEMDWREKARVIHEQLIVQRWPAYSAEDQRFLMLALSGEVGELANIVKKLWRQDSRPEGALARHCHGGRRAPGGIGSGALMHRARKWFAAAVYAVRGWWWLGWEFGLWVTPRAAWRYAHMHHDWERHLKEQV